MYSIRIEKDYLGFCAAHFISYEGDQREPLHGHNFTVRLVIEGALDENYYVLDFIKTKKILKKICDSLDHRLLLPLNNPYIKIEESDDGVSATYREERFLFPHRDVVLLPVPNVTSEQLARYICEVMQRELRHLGVENLTSIEVEVKESPGQGGIYRDTF